MLRLFLKLWPLQIKIGIGISPSHNHVNPHVVLNIFLQVAIPHVSVFTVVVQLMLQLSVEMCHNLVILNDLGISYVNYLLSSGSRPWLSIFSRKFIVNYRIRGEWF